MAEGIKAEGNKADIKRQEALTRTEAEQVRQLGDRSAKLQAGRVIVARQQAEQAGEKRKGEAVPRKAEPQRPTVDHKTAAADRARFNNLHSGRLHTPRPAEPAGRQQLETRRLAHASEAPRAGELAREAVAGTRTAGRVATENALAKVRDTTPSTVDPRLTSGSNPAAAAKTAEKGTGLLAGVLNALKAVFRPSTTTPSAPSAQNSSGEPSAAATPRPAASSNLPSEPGAPAAEGNPARVTIYAAAESTDVDASTKFFNLAMEGLAKFLPDAAAARSTVPDQPAKNSPGEFVVGRNQREARGAAGGNAPVKSGGSRSDLATAVAIQRWNDPGSRRG